MEVKTVILDKLPIHDTSWSMTAGADGKIYCAACCEMTGGAAAYMVRYDAATGKLDYLFDVGEVVGEPADNGRATQCKVHYSLLPTSDGLLWGTTHLSGAPKGDIVYPHWGGWRDRRRSYRGAMFFVLDLATDKIVDRGLMVPEEGSRAQALSERYGLIYVVGYPIDHFMVYDIKARKLTDCGRIGSVNPQTIWVDPDDNGYTADDFGRILRYDVQKRKLIELNVRVPHPNYQTGWHTVPYDVVAGPDPAVVFGVTWTAFPHFFRYDMGDGPEGRMDDLGPVHAYYTGEEPSQMGFDHVGGMVLADDGMIYCGVNTPNEKSEVETHLTRIDPADGKREDLGVAREGDHIAHYFARGARAGNGDLVFCTPSYVPTRLYIHRPDYSGKKKIPVPLRRWG